MNHYQYQGDNLRCEDLEIESITNEIETPFYCYSLRSLKDNINKYKENLKNTNSKISSFFAGPVDTVISLIVYF